MSTAELQTLEARIAAIEENLGIEGAKSLEQVLDEEAEARKNDAGIAFRAKYASHEITSLAELKKKLRHTIVVFCDSLDSEETQTAFERLDEELRQKASMFLKTRGPAQRFLDAQWSWGFWEKSDPLFEISDEELEGWTEGEELPVARLPDNDKTSDATTLWAMSGSAEPFVAWVNMR